MSRKAFSNLHYIYVCALLDILVSVRLSHLPHIKRRFDENSRGFDEVVSFLSALNILVVDGSSIRLNVDLPRKDKNFLRAEIMRRILGKRNRYRNEIFRFINQFSLDQRKITYMPPDQRRSTDSDVRNFLIDIGAVRYVQDAEKYALLPEYISLFVSARNNANFTPPALLENQVEARNEIGRMAEEIVVEHERVRVGPAYANKVDHVSKRNCAAGYDILSCSIEKDSKIIPRFIEVKAVSSRTFQFFWSKNEVAIARTFQDSYFLYLLPVSQNRQFEIEKLMMISNPCDNVLQGSSSWVIESDALICYLKSDASN